LTAFAIPAPAAWVYAALFAIALLACGAPLLVLRRDGPARTLRNVGLAAILIVPLMAALGFTMSDNELRLENGKLVLHAAHFYEHERPLAEFDLARARAGSLLRFPRRPLGGSQQWASACRVMRRGASPDRVAVPCLRC
jgi:hypothetical protein